MGKALWNECYAGCALRGGGRLGSGRGSWLHLPREGEALSRLRPLLLLLGLPTLGLAFGISVITTYGPVVLFHLAHSGTKVGVLIGSEGAFALVIPILAGESPIGCHLLG
jgi:hypothetical protein